MPRRDYTEWRGGDLLMGRKPTPEQERGTEFAGVVRENTLPAKTSVNDLTAGEKRTLIVTTGQDRDPAAKPRVRHFHGQAGRAPVEPLPPRYLR